MQIGSIDIRPSHPCFVIAEIGVNHNGEVDLAHQLIDEAVRVGANAAKFQTFIPAELASKSALRAPYQHVNGGGNTDQLSMLDKLAFAPNVFSELKAHCEAAGMVFLSSPFDNGSIDFLDALGIAAFKIPSGELTNLPFLQRISACGRPIILSTGMATLAEVRDAMQAIADAGEPPVAILHATSAYPTAPTDINLRAMQTLSETFGCLVGLSDHSDGIAIPIAATALGANIIEKHFTLDRAMPGPDHMASLDPDGFFRMVQGIRDVELAMGDGIKRPRESEREVAMVVRKSLVAAWDLLAGDEISEDMLKAKRPGYGISPSELQAVLGRRLRTDVPRDDLLDWKHLE